MASTTNYSWNTPDDTALVKDGASAIRTLGSSVDTTLFTALGGAYPGLRLVKKQTIGTGVSTVTVTGAFSSAYENYKIVISGGASSAVGYSTLTLGSTVTGYYMGYTGLTFTGTTSNAGNNNTAGILYSVFGHGTRGLNASIELLSPFSATETYFFSVNSANNQSLAGQGFLDNDTSYTAFTITPVSGTLTGGTIYVYGYGAS